MIQSLVTSFLVHWYMTQLVILDVRLDATVWHMCSTFVGHSSEGLGLQGSSCLPLTENDDAVIHWSHWSSDPSENLQKGQRRIWRITDTRYSSIAKKQTRYKNWYPRISVFVWHSDSWPLVRQPLSCIRALKYP